MSHFSAGLRIRSVIDRLVREGKATARTDGSHHQLFPISVPRDMGEALRTWVIRENATRTIEIGLAHGMSALHICEGLVANGRSNVCHVAIDPYQTTAPDGIGFAGLGLQLLEEAGVISIVEHHEEESQIALPRLLAERRTFDLAFIDGNHRFDRVFVDLYYLGHLVRRGGIVILDDYDLPGIARAVSFFVMNLGWKLEEAADNKGGHGWAVLRTSKTEDARHYADFTEF